MSRTKEIKKEVKEVKEEKNNNILMTVEATGEKVVYSEKVHGKDYKEIAKNTAEKFGGVLTEVE
jgi:hypothetical protein